ncbi:ANTAR domain-containing protein [Desulfotomaculum defluvii]
MFGRRVLLADPDPDFRKSLKDVLQQHGYLVIAETEEGRSTLQAAFQHQPDIVLMEGELPGSRGLEIARIIDEHHLAPVVLITSRTNREILEEAKVSSILGFLIKPIEDFNIIPTLEVALATFKKLVRIEEENKKLKKKLEEQRLVEQAKRLLYEKKGFNEQLAHRYMQKVSMDRCCSLTKVAQLVINSLSK